MNFHRMNLGHPTQPRARKPRNRKNRTKTKTRALARKARIAQNLVLVRSLGVDFQRQEVPRRAKSRGNPAHAYTGKSTRDDIRAAGSGAKARRLYESSCATRGASADTKRKWLRVVERLEAQERRVA